MGKQMTSKPVAKVTVNITPGPVTPAQRAAWRKFWAARIAEAKGKLNSEGRIERS